MELSFRISASFGFRVSGFNLDEGNTGGVIDKVRLDELNSLPRIQRAFEHEVEVIEVELQLLVGVIDTELLEMVGLEHLEAENVEHRYLQCIVHVPCFAFCRCVVFAPVSWQGGGDYSCMHSHICLRRGEGARGNSKELNTV